MFYHLFFVGKGVITNPLSLFQNYIISTSTISPLHHFTVFLVSCPIPDCYAKIPNFIITRYDKASYDAAKYVRPYKSSSTSITVAIEVHGRDVIVNI